MENSRFYLFFVLYIVAAAFFIHSAQMGFRLEFYLPEADHDAYPIGSFTFVHLLSDLIHAPYIAVAAFLLFFLVVAPSLVIAKISGNLSGVFYLLSGIPFLLLDGGNIAQSMIQFLMVLSLWFSPFYFIFALIGGEIHREWFAAFLLTFVFDSTRRLDGIGKVL